MKKKLNSTEYCFHLIFYDFPFFTSITMQPKLKILGRRKRFAVFVIRNKTSSQLCLCWLKRNEERSILYTHYIVPRSNFLVRHVENTSKLSHRPNTLMKKWNTFNRFFYSITAKKTNQLFLQLWPKRFLSWALISQATKDTLLSTICDVTKYYIKTHRDESLDSLHLLRYLLNMTDHMYSRFAKLQKEVYWNPKVKVICGVRYWNHKFSIWMSLIKPCLYQLETIIPCESRVFLSDPRF